MYVHRRVVYDGSLRPVALPDVWTLLTAGPLGKRFFGRIMGFARAFDADEPGRSRDHPYGWPGAPGAGGGGPRGERYAILENLNSQTRFRG